MSKERILILGKLPPPFMGPAIATNIILNSSLKDQFDLFHFDTKLNQSVDKIGIWSFGKSFKFLSFFTGYIQTLQRSKAKLVLVPISQSTMGFLKDSLYILFAWLWRKKVIIQLRGSNFKNWRDKTSWPTRAYLRFIIGMTHGVIVLGNNLKYLFRDYYPEDQIFVVPNGADYQFPSSSMADDEKVNILYLANLFPSKGLEDVLKAITILKNTSELSFELLVCGAWLNPPFKQACLELIEKESLPVTIHPSVSGNAKWQTFADADIFVFPPRMPEGHPWVIVEAMAAGLPIISTDQGAIVESVTHGENGFIVDCESPEQIAQKLTLLIRDENLRKLMGEKSKGKHATHFSEKQMTQKLGRVFSTVIYGNKQLEGVTEFWNGNLCGNQFVDSEYFSERFFKEYTEFRYKKTHHLNTYINWEGAKGKDLLEVGLGIGADSTRWAKHAKSYTGIDLTKESVEATRKHFEIKGLQGSIHQDNAEAMSLQDQSYDLIFSHGVIHHTPDITKALAEINRVLRPNGEVILMLYAKNSINYWVRIQVYFRIQFLIAWAKSKLGMSVKEPWGSHLKNLKREGWSYFSWNEWPHHCTDGPDCSISNIFPKATVERLLDQAGFKITKMKKAHLPLGLSPRTEQKLASVFGFHRLIWAQKKNQ